MRIAIVVGLLGCVALAQGAGQAGSLFEKGEYAKAIEAAGKVVEKDPTKLDAWIVIIDSNLKLLQPGDAWDAAERAMRAIPDNARLDLKLAEVFTGMAEQEQRSTGDGTTITNYYLDSERMYDSALAKDPKMVEAVYGKALVNFYMSKMPEARKLLADALALDPKFGKAHALQGFMLYGEKKYADAARKYEVAVELDGSDPLDWVRYGHCFYAQNQMDKAKEIYIAGLKRHPDSSVPILSGLYYVAGRSWKNAVDVLKEATTAVPKSADAWYYYGYALFQNNRYGEAADAFKKALAIRPGDASFVYFLGYAAESGGDAAQALDCYRKALKLNPDMAEAAARFELIIRNQTDLERIEKLYEELCELAPRNGWAQNNYGLILRDWCEKRGAAASANVPPEVKRRLQRSGEYYEKAAAVLSEEPQIQSDTGLMFEYYPAIRDDAKAKKYFTRSLELSDYTYRDAFDGLTRLCERTGDWSTLLDYAEGVIGAIERGKQAIAPVGGGAPAELGRQQTDSLKARAEKAAAMAKSKLG